VSGSRAARLGDELRRLLARMLREELRDPRVGFVTLTEVKLSPDLRYAVAYVSLIDSALREETLYGLNRAVPFLRRLLAREAGLRFTPALRFVHDSGAESAQRLERILAEERRAGGAAVDADDTDETAEE
jgi:ribosome-binding factor A